MFDTILKNNLIKTIIQINNKNNDRIINLLETWSGSKRNTIPND